MIKKLNTKDALLLLFFITYFTVGYFNRSFVGLKIFDYRIGEFIVLIGFLISIYIFITGNTFIYDRKILTYFRFIIITFLLSSIISNSSFLNTYTYKSSSYVWTVGYIFLGIYIGKFNIKKSNYFFIVCLVVLFSYIFSTGNYPNFIIDFFKEYSDKFQFTKASDSFHLIIISSLIVNFFTESKFLQLSYLYSISFLFLPLLIYQSRGSFIGILLYLIIETFYVRRFLISEPKKTLIIFLSAIIFLVIGIYRISGKNTSELSEEPVKVITETSERIIENKDTVETIFSFYIDDGRLFSSDPTANWRLDIWQDVIFDLSESGKNLIGYGYKEVIPVMVDGSAPGRLGKDGMNEHVHNYFFTTISRGGYIHFGFFVLFYFSIIRFWYLKFKNFRILSYLIPVFFVSSLDITMDGAHFPFIFFLTLGYMLSSNKSLEYKV